MNPDERPQRTFFQKVQLLFFFLGIITFFSYLFFDIQDSAIFYTQHNDARPLLTSILGRIFAPDYILYLSITSLKMEGLSKEAVGAIKNTWFLALTSLVLIHLFIGILCFKLPIEKKYCIGLFLLSIILLACLEMIYVALLAGKFMPPYLGLYRSFTLANLKLLFTVAGSYSIESTILTSTNLTIII